MENQQTTFLSLKDIVFSLLLIYWCYCFWAVFKIARWVAAFSAEYNVTSVTIQAAVILLASAQLVWAKLSRKKAGVISSAKFTVIFQIVCGLAIAVLIMTE